MRIDLVALDLDGTLLDGAGRVSAENRAALRRLGRSGIRTVFVTGRAPEFPIALARELGLTDPLVCAHGALTRDFAAQRTVAHHPIALDEARAIVAFAEERALPTAVLVGERLSRRADVAFPADLPLSSWRPVERLADALVAAPTMIRVFGDDAVAATVRAFESPSLAFHIEQWHAFAECAILDARASKRSALARLCADFQIPPERVLAMGDSINDVPMLRWAGVGVAMGNAPLAVRQAVRYVTATNDDDGVAKAIDRFVPLTTTARRPA